MNVIRSKKRFQELELAKQISILEDNPNVLDIKEVSLILETHFTSELYIREKKQSVYL